MNIYSRNTSLSILEESEISNLHINDYIHNYFNKTKIPPLDKKFINKLVLGTVRLKGRYDYIISQIYHGDYMRLKLKLKNILRLGCYQIEQMNSVPNHASISIMVEITKKHLKGYEKLVNAILRKFTEGKKAYDFDINSSKTFPLLSHPSWLIDKWIKEFGIKKMVELCKYNNQDPSIWFRINNSLELTNIYSEVEKLSLVYNKHVLSEVYFTVDSPYNLIESDLFKNGDLSIQNPINGFIVNILNPKKNEIIIDGCSAPGGKGSLISLMAPHSKIYSIEINKNRISKIEESINRHKLKNISILNLDMSKDRLPLADKILIDVPCSGTGVINRRVDLRWKRKSKDITNSAKLQYKILMNSSKYLKNNGVIVYSTCSIEAEENSKIINLFIKNNKNYILEDSGKIINPSLVKNNNLDVLPGKYDLDGGFAAKLRKI